MKENECTQGFLMPPNHFAFGTATFVHFVVNFRTFVFLFSSFVVVVAFTLVQWFQFILYKRTLGVREP